MGGALCAAAVLRGFPERLPVLYLLHGADDSSAEMLDHFPIPQLAVGQKLAVVLPDADTSYYTNAKHRRDARWEDAIAKDLLQDVSTRFAVLTGPAHTGIAGISMGGYGAAKLALKHPELYGFAGVLNGALEITRRSINIRRLKQRLMIWTIFGYRKEARRDEDVFDLALETQQHIVATKWFVSCGKGDAFYPYNERFAHELKQRGVAVSFVSTEGGHDFPSWKQTLPRLMQDAGSALAP